MTALGSETFSLLMLTPPPCTILRASPFDGKTAVSEANRSKHRNPGLYFGFLHSELRHTLEDIEERLLVKAAQRVLSLVAEKYPACLHGCVVFLFAVDQSRSALWQDASAKDAIPDSPHAARKPLNLLFCQEREYLEILLCILVADVEP